MLIIRLQRFGRKNQPSFRLVVTEKQKSPHGKYVENLGFLDMINKKSRINKERVIYWLNNGAQVSDSAWNFLVTEKVIEGKKRNVFKKKKKKKEKEQSSASKEPKKETKESSKTKNTEEVDNPASI